MPLRVRDGTQRRLFAQGVVVNVLNPKTALFFLAFLPQFVDPSRGATWSQVLVLGVLFMLLGSSRDSLYALTAGTIAGASPPAAKGIPLWLGRRLHRPRRVAALTTQLTPSER